MEARTDLSSKTLYSMPLRQSDQMKIVKNSLKMFSKNSQKKLSRHLIPKIAICYKNVWSPCLED